MALGRALRQQGSESLASNHPRAERPERKNGIDIRPQDLVQYMAMKAERPESPGCGGIVLALSDEK